MDPFNAFLLSFGATVALLFAAFATGLRGLRRTHLAIVAATLVGLVVAIWFAIAVGRELVFDPGVQRIHRSFAMSVVILLAPMAVTGIGILLGGRTRMPHRITAVVLLATALTATATGFWMKSTGKPRPPGAPTALGGTP